MAHYLCQFTGYGSVDVFDGCEVGWEEDVEVALLDLIQRMPF